MSKFNQYGSTETNISDGTEDIFGNTLRANNLEANQPVKSNSIGQLISSKLDINDVNNLQTILDDTITTPYDGTIQATDFSTALIPSFNSAIGSIPDLVSKTQYQSTTPNNTTFSGTLNTDNFTANTISSLNPAIVFNTNIDMNTYDMTNVNNITTLQYTATNGTLRNINSFENQNIIFELAGETPGYVQADRIKTDSISSYQLNIELGSNLVGNNTVSITGLSSVSANDISSSSVPSLNTFAYNTNTSIGTLETKAQNQTAVSGTTTFSGIVNAGTLNSTGDISTFIIPSLNTFATNISGRLGTLENTDITQNGRLDAIELDTQNILSSSLSPIQTVFDGEVQCSNIKINTISSANEETNLVNLVCPIDMGGYNIFNANSIQTAFFSGVQTINSKPDTDINVNLLGIEPTNFIVPRIKTNSISTITGDLSINTNIDMNNYDIKNVNNITTLQYTATNGTLRNINSFENQDINLQNTGETPGYVQASRIKTDSISSYQTNIELGSNLVGTPNNTVSITGLSSVSALQLTSGNDIATITIPSLNTFASNISGRATSLETKTQYITSTTGTTSFGSNINMNFFNLNQVDQLQTNNIIDLSGITSKSNEDISVNLVGTSNFSVGKIRTNQLINGLGGALTNILLNSSLDFQNSMRINNVAKIGTNSINTDIIASLTAGNPISLTSDISATNKNITGALAVSATDLSSTNLTTTNLKQGAGGALTSVVMGSNLNLGGTYKIDNANKLSTSSINADIINSFTPGSPVQVVSDVVFSTNKNISGTTNISSINVSSANLITNTLKQDVGGVLTNILMGSSLDFQNTMRINNVNKLSTSSINTDLITSLTAGNPISLTSDITATNKNITGLTSLSSTNIECSNNLDVATINSLRPLGGVYVESTGVQLGPGIIDENLITGTLFGNGTLNVNNWGSRVFLAGVFKAGDFYHIKCSGRISRTGGGNETLALKIRFGLLILLQIDVVTQATLTNSNWELEADLIVKTIGFSGSMVNNGTFVYQQDGTGGAIRSYSSSNSVSGVNTTTANNELNITINQTLSASTTTLTSLQGIITKVF